MVNFSVNRSISISNLNISHLNDHDPAMAPQLHPCLADDTVNSLFPCRQRLGRHHGHQAALLRLGLVIDTVYNRGDERTCDFQYLLYQFECHYNTFSVSN